MHTFSERCKHNCVNKNTHKHIYIYIYIYIYIIYIYTLYTQRNILANENNQFFFMILLWVSCLSAIFRNIFHSFLKSLTDLWYELFNKTNYWTLWFDIVTTITDRKYSLSLSLSLSIYIYICIYIYIHIYIYMNMYIYIYIYM